MLGSKAVSQYLTDVVTARSETSHDDSATLSSSYENGAWLGTQELGTNLHWPAQQGAHRIRSIAAFLDVSAPSGSVSAVRSWKQQSVLSNASGSSFLHVSVGPLNRRCQETVASPVVEGEHYALSKLGRARHSIRTAFGDADPKELDAMPIAFQAGYRVFMYGGFIISAGAALKFRSQIQARGDQNVQQAKQIKPERSYTQVDDGSVPAPEPAPPPAPAPGAASEAAAGAPAQDPEPYSGGVTLVGDQIADYNTFMLLSPLHRLKHTIFDDFSVWGRACYAMVFFFGLSIVIFECCTTFYSHGGWYFMKDFITDKEVPKRMTDLLARLLGFESFFLGFYTSVTLGRWFMFWNDGILRMFRGSEKMTLMLACDLPASWEEVADPTQPPSRVSRDDVVSLIPRWTRASLCLIFEMYGRGRSGEAALETARGKDLLTEQERQALSQVPGDQALAILTWHFKLITRLIEKKLVKIAHQPYHITHNETFYGAVNLMEHSRHPLPFVYTSLISILTTLITGFTACVAGGLFTRALLHYDELEAMTHFLSVFASAVIFNAVVVLNVNLANPLQDLFTNESEEALQQRYGSATTSIICASNNMPAALTTDWQVSP